GPALGGLLYALGPATVYGTVTALIVVAGILIAAIRDVNPRSVRAALTSSSLLSGVEFILRRRVLLGALSLDLFAVLPGGATALLPIYAHAILVPGPRGPGLLRAAPARGAPAP